MRFERLGANGRKEYLIEMEGIARSGGDGEMAAMRRIEASAKKRDAVAPAAFWRHAPW